MTVPGAPTILSTRAGNGAATVAWRAPAANGRRPILGYELSRRTTVLRVGTSRMKATLSGLPRHRRLRVAVRARTAMGWGAYAYTPYQRSK
jgi:hypothetical protein